MSVERDALLAHLRTGETRVCRAWGVERKDGMRLGFTDHDRDLSFAGWTFRAGTGLTAGSLMQTTGLAVDNVEAIGGLSADAITEADIVAGRYDDASVICWLVNWSDPAARMVLFRGSMGEVSRAGGAFRAELRGLSEVLNQPCEWIYQKTCSAVLGDVRCGVDLADAAYRAEWSVAEVTNRRSLRFAATGGFADGWFAQGRLTVLIGAGSGLVGQIRADRIEDGMRVLDLWQELRAEMVAGDVVRLEAGCDKRLATCRAKFGNVANFRGFPQIPGEDWVTSYPRRGRHNDGKSYLRLPGEEV